MKALLALAVVSTLALVSCQQVYVDKGAREADAALTSTISPPSYSPNNIVIPSTATSYVTGSNYTSFCADALGALTGSTLTTSTSNTVPGTGLPNYSTIFSTTYGTTTDSGTATSANSSFNNNLLGTYTRSVQDYEEESPAFAAASSTATQVFKKALHRVYVNEYTINVNYDDHSGTTFTGTYTFKQRGEWYKDVTMLSGSRTDVQYGISELSISFAVSHTLASGEGAKVIGTYYVSQPYRVSADQTLSWSPLVNITAYDNVNNAYSTPLSNSDIYYDPNDYTQG